jgi:amphi-Trp domain-containing protein
MERETDFKYKSIQDCQTVLEYLDELRAGFLSGRIDFVNENERISLHPKGLLNFEIKASNRDSKGKITLKMTWKEKNLKFLDQTPLIIKTED